MNWTQVSYLYDGSLAGFLTCVFEAYTHREEPADFTPFDQACASFYASARWKPTGPRPSGCTALWRPSWERRERTGCCVDFLPACPTGNLWLWRFLRLGYKRGPGFTRDLTHPVVNQVHKAVQALSSEAHLFTGFVRFSQLEGVLVGTITPKNRVLPLLRIHFCSRLPQEQFLLYDKTHQEALVHTPGRWAILPMEDFEIGPADQEELAYRKMWRSFYHTISIEGRYNPKCRMTHMPKRYWEDMTEFAPPEQEALAE